MATWGGSTVDNLESITEDGGADQQDNEEEDDDGRVLMLDSDISPAKTVYLYSPFTAAMPSKSWLKL